MKTRQNGCQQSKTNNLGGPDCKIDGTVLTRFLRKFLYEVNTIWQSDGALNYQDFRLLLTNYIEEINFYNFFHHALQIFKENIGVWVANTCLTQKVFQESSLKQSIIEVIVWT